MRVSAHRRLAWTLGLALAALVSSPAAVEQQPARAAPAATIAGTLVTDESSPRPVRRAVLRLTGGDGAPRLTSTDDEGRFAFARLPAGRYSLSATRTGYVDTFYGSKRPGHGPSVPIVVADGARADVTMKMAHGAVITGTVTDDQGQPISNLLVQVIDAETRISAPAGPVSSILSLLPNVPPMSAMTDDRGVYRVFGLPPGVFVVTALPRTGDTVNATNLATLAVTDDEVRWALAQTATPGRPPTRPPPPGPSVTYAPIYFPGTADVDVAQAVSLAMGEERSAVSFPLRLVPTANITGTIVDPAGQPITPVSAALVRKPGPRSTVASWLWQSALSIPRASITDNGFSFANITPGDYLLVARTGGGTRTAVAAATYWAIVDLLVQGQDQRGLTVRLQPGAKISGSIVFSGTSLRPPADLSTLSVTLAPILALPGMPTPSALVASGGTFSFASVAPTAFDLRIVPPPGAAGPAPHWMLKSAMVNGKDLADTPIDLKGVEELTGVTITFTDRTTEISGKVLGAEAGSTAAYSAVVFPADRALWSPTSRRIKAVRLATNSTFSLTDLPPGRYCLAVVDDLDTADLTSPDFLAQLQAAAVTIALAEGEHMTQDLRVGKSE
jgi:hypothetical protein